MRIVSDKFVEKLKKKTHVLRSVKIIPITGPEGPRGFQEVKVPRFRDNGTG